MRTTITPEMAQKFLDNNPINRPPNKVNVNFLAQEILDGRFVYNGESVIIAENGQLLDGQHRLLAVILAKKSIDANLVTGVPVEVMGTIDTGRARTAADLFSMEGIEHSKEKASVTKKIMNKIGLGRRTASFSQSATVRSSNTEQYEFYTDHKEDIDYIHDRLHVIVTSGKYPRMITFSLAGSLTYLLGIIDHRSLPYIRELFTGRQEGQSNIAILIRDRLIKSMLSSHKLSETSVRNMIINGFEGYCEGRHLKKLGGVVYGTPEFKVKYTTKPNFLKEL